MLSLGYLMKRPRDLILFITLVLILVATSLPANAGSSEETNILVVFSWHKSMPWQMEVEKGFEEHFEEKSLKPNLFYEYMDSGRFKSRSQY